ncbi:NAD(P)-binding protein [Xylariaceae sp. AK1471]|nr:NAD(P)-binding protein [Xylariaceae sp. AK1471]
MAQRIETVMVLGGTGHLGSHIVSSLSSAGFKVTVLGRSRPTTSSIIPSNVRVLQSDYTFSSLVDAFKGQDAVVSVIATLSVPQQLSIIDAAVAAKVKRILPSEFGADTSVENEDAMAAVLKGKQEVVKYLATKEAAGLSWTALCTGAWVDWMLEEGHGLLCFDIKSRTATIIDSGDQKFTAITIKLAAEATASVLLHPEETKNRYMQVHSFTLTQNMILAALERISGNKFSINKLSRVELLARATKYQEEGDYDTGHHETVTAMIYSGSKVMHFPERAIHGNKVLGLVEEEDLDGMIKRVLTNIQKS